MFNLRSKVFSLGYLAVIGLLIAMIVIAVGIVGVVAGKWAWVAGIIILLLFYIFRNSLKQYLSRMIVPTNYFGIREILGRRMPLGVLYEGFHFVLPLVEQIEIFNLEPVRLEAKVEGITGGDSLEIIVECSIEYRPDPNVLEKGIPTFSNYERSVVEKGIIDEVKEKVNVVCGTKTSTAEGLVLKREEFILYINSWLRLSEPPHLNKPPEEILDYYRDHRETINDSLMEEEKNIDDRSKIEERYGIDVIKINIKKISFSEKTMKLMELRKQTEEEEQANKKLLDMIQESAQKLGITPEKAIDMILTTTNPGKNVKTRIFNISDLEKVGRAIANKF